MLYGRVLDSRNRGIPGAVVAVTNRSDGTYCDSLGRFSIMVNTDSIRGFTVFSIGFEKRNVGVDRLFGDSVIIYLRESYNYLDDYVVTGKKVRIKEGVLGKKKLSPSGGCYMMYGDEVAIFLSADPRKKEFLKEVFFYITGDGVPQTKFRIHVYDKDPAGLFPGYDLLDTDVVLHANAGNEWVSTDLGKKRIAIHDGIFVSVEWVQDYGNNDEILYQKNYPPNYIAGSVNHIFNGQVLGLTQDYGLQQLQYISYKDHHNLWNSENPVMSMDSKNAGMRINHWFNPMIYATYTCAKKRH